MIYSNKVKSEEYIFGEKFRNFSEKPNIFYVDTHNVMDFFHYSESLNDQFVLITHNSDNCITQNISDYIDSNVPNLKAWFGQNIDCFNERIQSLPIGLENTKNWAKFSKSDLLYDWSTKNIVPSKLAYANFSLWTYPNERNRCYEFVKNSKFITNRCLHSVVQDEYENWINEVLDHKYVLCPRGNGIDTHRFWETLYLGRIPITKRNLNTRFYEDLPALYIDDWSELTEDLLISKLDWFKDKKNFNFEKLKMNYWKKIIFEKLNKKLK